MNDTQPQTLFENGIAYEAAREGLNNEISLHRDILRRLEETDPQKIYHRKAIQNLHEVRGLLHPDDPKTTEIVRLLLRSIYNENNGGNHVG